MITDFINIGKWKKKQWKAQYLESAAIANRIMVRFEFVKTGKT